MATSVSLTKHMSARIVNEEAAVRVSVLMLTCDRPQFIDRAIASVLSQQFPSWELIVVHDGADESVAPAMRRWVAADPRIRYFRRAEKRNIANAYNFALSHARGEYVAILDDDDYWITSQKLAQQVHFLDAHRDYVGCGGGMIIVDPEEHELMRCLKRESDAEIRRWALVANPMAHSTTMFRRVVAGQPIRYDETLGGFQDWNLWLQLAQLGRLYNFPALFTGYTLWRGSASFGTQRACVRSAVTIIRRHRAAYRGLPAAMAVVSLQYVYAFLPAALRRYSFVPLSKMKKRIFGGRADPRAAFSAGTTAATGVVAAQKEDTTAAAGS
jgi:glycosyltransferase involved in cell wall biosynthesis